MSKVSAEILELLKALTKDMEEVKVAVKNLHEQNTSSAVTGEEMYKALNAKFDIFKNLETQSRETTQQAAAAPRKLTRPMFFKRLFLDEREKHMNVLYTQEEIDAIMQHPDVLKKTKEADKYAKAAGLLFTTHIKADNPAGRLSAFSALYDSAF